LWRLFYIWPKNQSLHGRLKLRNSALGLFIVVSDAEESVVICAISISAVSASESLQTKEKFLVSKNHLGNL